MNETYQCIYWKCKIDSLMVASNMAYRMWYHLRIRFHTNCNTHDHDMSWRRQNHHIRQHKLVWSLSWPSGKVNYFKFAKSLTAWVITVDRQSTIKNLLPLDTVDDRARTGNRSCDVLLQEYSHCIFPHRLYWKRLRCWVSLQSSSLVIQCGPVTFDLFGCRRPARPARPDYKLGLARSARSDPDLTGLQAGIHPRIFIWMIVIWL